MISNPGIKRILGKTGSASTHLSVSLFATHIKLEKSYRNHGISSYSCGKIGAFDVHWEKKLEESFGFLYYMYI